MKKKKVMLVDIIEFEDVQIFHSLIKSKKFFQHDTLISLMINLSKAQLKESKFFHPRPTPLGSILGHVSTFILELKVESFTIYFK